MTISRDERAEIVDVPKLERASQPSRRRRPGRPTQHRKLTYRQVIDDAAASRVLLKT